VVDIHTYSFQKEMFLKNVQRCLAVLK